MTIPFQGASTAAAGFRSGQSWQIDHPHECEDKKMKRSILAGFVSVAFVAALAGCGSSSSTSGSASPSSSSSSSSQPMRLAEACPKIIAAIDSAASDESGAKLESEAESLKAIAAQLPAAAQTAITTLVTDLQTLAKDVKNSQAESKVSAAAEAVRSLCAATSGSPLPQST